MGLYLLMILPAALLGLWAQYKVKSAFERFSQVANSSGMSGAEAAATMLQNKGFQIVQSEEMTGQLPNGIAIVETNGFLSDHYDPASRTLRLSPSVYEGRSISAVGVACHEAGHALQHAQHYAPLALRSIMVPVAQFGSWLYMPLILIGAFIAAFKFLIPVGILLFTAIVLFQIVTLPVEFDASRRAKAALASMGIVRGEEENAGVASVLDAAALTYVAAAISAVMTLLYYIMVFTGGRRD